MKYLVKHKLFNSYLKTSKWDMLNGIEATPNKYDAEELSEKDAKIIANIFNTVDGGSSWIVVEKSQE